MLYVLHCFNHDQYNHTYLSNEIVAREIVEKSHITPFRAFYRQEGHCPNFELLAINEDNRVVKILPKPDCQIFCRRFVFNVAQDLLYLHSAYMQIPIWLVEYMQSPYHDFYSIDLHKEISRRIQCCTMDFIRNNRPGDKEKILVFSFVQQVLNYELNYSDDLQIFADEATKYLGKQFIANRFNLLYETRIMQAEEVNWLIFSQQES